MNIFFFSLVPNIHLRIIKLFYLIIIAKSFRAQLQRILAKYLQQYTILEAMLKEFTGIKESSRHFKADDFTSFVMLSKRDKVCVAFEIQSNNLLVTAID